MKNNQINTPKKIESFINEVYTVNIVINTK